MHFYDLKSNIYPLVTYIEGLPRQLSGKEPACQCRRYRFNPWVFKIPGKSHGQRTLAGYNP